MHPPGRPLEAESAAPIVALPVTPVRTLLPLSGLPCRLHGDPAVLRRAIAQAAGSQPRRDAASVACPDCGARNRPHRRFCCDCGAALAPGAMLHSVGGA